MNNEYKTHTEDINLIRNRIQNQQLPERIDDNKPVKESCFSHLLDRKAKYQFTVLKLYQVERKASFYELL